MLVMMLHENDQVGEEMRYTYQLDGILGRLDR